MNEPQPISEKQMGLLNKLLKEKDILFGDHAAANGVNVAAIEQCSKHEASALISAFIGDKPRDSPPVVGNTSRIETMLEAICDHFNIPVVPVAPEQRYIPNEPYTPQAQPADPPEWEAGTEPF